MFAMTTAQRWWPNWPVAAVLLSLGLYGAVLYGTLAALRGPVLLGYAVAPGPRLHSWRVTAVWPSSFAWDAGLRPGTLLRAHTRPATEGTSVVGLWTAPCCRRITLPPRENSAPALVGLELALAATVLAFGAGALLLARARLAALLLLLFCVDVAAGLCGVAAFAHGAAWGSVLFETCWFALLPPLTLLLATNLPPGERSSRVSRVRVSLSWAFPAFLGAIVLVVEAVGFVDVALYIPTRNVEGVLFALSQLLTIVIWVWRARAARGGPRWPDYRLVLLGVGGAFGGFALLAILPAMLAWPLPWPVEASGLILLLFPASLSWALLRHHLLELRRTVQRTAITVLLLGAVLCAGLILAADGMSAAEVVVVVLLAGAAVPAAQRGIDRLLPDSRATYAALVQQSGERLGLAVGTSEVSALLDGMRRGLGLAGLSLRRGDLALAQAGTIAPAPVCRLPVRHEGNELAVLEVGEKLRHDDLFAADREALAILCQQLGAFMARQRLILQLSETVAQLEEAQGRLLTARRRERERLGQVLHRGPLQTAVLLRRILRRDSIAAEATRQLEAELRAILTATASTALRDLGLPAALRAYAAYLIPYAREQGCVLTVEVDGCAGGLDHDTSFALYQLAHEALSNAVHHSGGQHVAARLWSAGDTVLLEVCDDGRGLPAGWERGRVDHRGLREALDLMHTVKGATQSARWAAVQVRARSPPRRALSSMGALRADTLPPRGLFGRPSNPPARKALIQARTVCSCWPRWRAARHAPPGIREAHHLQPIAGARRTPSLAGARAGPGVAPPLR